MSNNSQRRKETERLRIKVINKRMWRGEKAPCPQQMFGHFYEVSLIENFSAFPSEISDRRKERMKDLE